MFKVNNRVLVKRKHIFRSDELLKGRIVAIKNPKGETDFGYKYDQIYYHILLDDGRHIIISDTPEKFPFFESYKLLLA